MPERPVKALFVNIHSTNKRGKAIKRCSLCANCVCECVREQTQLPNDDSAYSIAARRLVAWKLCKRTAAPVIGKCYWTGLG